MREEVCIVLNEREPNKARIAELLELRFKTANITASRLAVDEHTPRVVAERAPRFVILDYLLGDVSTGLDVMAAMQSLPAEARPRVYFLTDEPSVKVAVDALKMGAADYLEIENHQAVETITALIESALRDLRRPPPPAPPAPLRLDDLVLGSTNIQSAIAQAQGALIRRAPGIVLFGQPGAGLTTIARALALDHGDGLGWSYVDVPTFLHPPQEISGAVVNHRGGIGVPLHHTLILDRCEADDGEILTSLADGGIGSAPLGGTVIAVTTDPQTADAYSRLFGGERVNIPPLNSRRTDVPALVQRFVREAENLGVKRIPPFDAPCVNALAELVWPQNVRQLKAVVFNTAIAAAAAGAPAGELIEAEHRRTCDDAAPSAAAIIDPLTAAVTLEENGHNHRRAAARLGCSLTQLRAALALGRSTGSCA